jgi:hypothetical protein
MTAIVGAAPRFSETAALARAPSRLPSTVAGPSFSAQLQLGPLGRSLAGRQLPGMSPFLPPAASRTPGAQPGVHTASSTPSRDVSVADRRPRAEPDVDAPREAREPAAEPNAKSVLGAGVTAFAAITHPAVSIIHDAPAVPAGPPSLEHLMSKLVRRIAWSGDAHRGSARLEVGAGPLEGATLIIHADDGVLRVVLDLPPGVDRNEWRDRIAERLGARGFQLGALEVE